MKKYKELLKHLLLLLLFVLSFMVGIDVIIRYEADFLGHSEVPLVLILLFICLVISLGYTLGATIKSSGLMAKIIIYWPVLQLLAFLFLFLFGQEIYFIGLLLVIPMYFLPLNLVGFGISLGFQFSRLFLSEGNERIKLVIFMTINIVIIVFVTIEAI